MLKALVNVKQIITGTSCTVVAFGLVVVLGSAAVALE